MKSSVFQFSRNSKKLKKTGHLTPVSHGKVLCFFHFLLYLTFRTFHFSRNSRNSLFVMLRSSHFFRFRENVTSRLITNSASPTFSWNTKKIVGALLRTRSLPNITGFLRAHFFLERRLRYDLLNFFFCWRKKMFVIVIAMSSS